MADYFIGLDLGQASEYTGCAVIERTPRRMPSGEWTWHHGVRHLQRFSPGTPYHAVLDWLLPVLGHLGQVNITLVIDQTSVGRPVFEMFRWADLPVAIRSLVIGSGHRPTVEVGCRVIPKRDLASTLQLVFQRHRLQIAPELPEAQTLCEELAAFRIKTPPMPNDFESWRERDHDDLVLAVAIAVWWGERERAGDPSEPSTVLSFLDEGFCWERWP